MKLETLIKQACAYMEKRAFSSKPVLTLAGKVKNKLMKEGAGSASSLMSRAKAHLGDPAHVGLHSKAEKEKFKNSMIELGKRHGISHVEAAHAVRKGAMEAHSALKI